jgi:hypothetical protein
MVIQQEAAPAFFDQSVALDVASCAVGQSALNGRAQDSSGLERLLS